MLFGALAAGATALLGRRLFGELAGLVAGLALAASSYFVSWSQAARGYTLAVLLAMVATYAFVRACDDARPDGGLLWAVTLAAAGWVNVFAFSVAAAHLVAFLLMRPRPPLRAPVLAASGPSRCSCRNSCSSCRETTASSTGYRRRRRITSPWACGTGRAGIRSPCSRARSASSSSFREAVPRAARWKAALVAVWLVAPLAATLLASISQPAFEARYVLVGLPALALAIGAAVVSIPRSWALALAIALAITMTIRLVQHYVDAGRRAHPLNHG